MKSINSRSGGRCFSGAGWMELLVDSEEGVTLKDGRKCLRFSLMYIYSNTSIRTEYRVHNMCTDIRTLRREYRTP